MKCILVRFSTHIITTSLLEIVKTENITISNYNNEDGGSDCEVRRAEKLDIYSMFHVTWTTFKFNRNQLGTVSVFVMISVPWNNQGAQVISEKLLSKEFHCATTDHK